MSVTLDQVTEIEERLRAEIVQRECLLAAIGDFRSYNAKGQWPESLDLASLSPAMFSPVRNVVAEPPLWPPPPSLPDAPPPPPPARYVHPELKAILDHRPTDGEIVRWAIMRLTEEYTVRDIADLLQRCGYEMEGRRISVVLTRFKNRGEIIEVKRGIGRIAARFQKPDNPIALDLIAAESPPH
jgi:hypothetical protein